MMTSTSRKAVAEGQAAHRAGLWCRRLASVSDCPRAAIWKPLRGTAWTRTLHQVSVIAELTRQYGRNPTRCRKRSAQYQRCCCAGQPSSRDPAQDRRHSARWRKLFDKLVTDRKPFLIKQRPPRQAIEAAGARNHFETVREEIPAAVHGVIELSSTLHRVGTRRPPWLSWVGNTGRLPSLLGFFARRRPALPRRPASFRVRVAGSAE